MAPAKYLSSQTKCRKRKKTVVSYEKPHSVRKRWKIMTEWRRFKVTSFTNIVGILVVVSSMIDFLSVCLSRYIDRYKSVEIKLKKNVCWLNWKFIHNGIKFVYGSKITFTIDMVLVRSDQRIKSLGQNEENHCGTDFLSFSLFQNSWMYWNNVRIVIRYAWMMTMNENSFDQTMMIFSLFIDAIASSVIVMLNVHVSVGFSICLYSIHLKSNQISNPLNSYQFQSFHKYFANISVYACSRRSLY